MNCVAITLALALAWQPDQLTIVVRQGTNAQNNVRTRMGAAPAVEVRDERGRPVADAAVTFRMPGWGPGGAFHGWMREQTVRTDSEGNAAAQGFAPNGETGSFEITVTAKAGGKIGSTLISQTNGPPGAAPAGRGPWRKRRMSLLALSIASTGTLVAASALTLRRRPGSKVAWWQAAMAGGSVLALIASMTKRRGQPADELATAAGPVTIAPVHHASIVLRSRDGVIHIDPSGASYYTGAPTADLVLITDAHGDHFDPAILPRLCRSGTVVFGSAAAARESELVTPVKNGEKKVWRHWEIEAAPAYNLPRAGPGRPFHEKGEGNAYVLSYGGKRFYISGNTGSTPELRARDGIDVAFLSMNPPYTMTAKEAAEAARVFKPKIVYPYHYRGNLLAPFEFKNALGDSGIEVRTRNWYK